MSMSLIVGEFTKKTDEELDANYKELCKSVYLTEYMNEVILGFTEELKTYEKISDSEYDEIIYKTISIPNIGELTKKIDRLIADYFEKYGSTKGKTEKDAIVSHLKNLVDLNYVIRETLYLSIATHDSSKALLLIIAWGKSHGEWK